MVLRGVNMFADSCPGFSQRLFVLGKYKFCNGVWTWEKNLYIN
jgi:hypothetical protein